MALLCYGGTPGWKGNGPLKNSHLKRRAGRKRQKHFWKRLEKTVADHFLWYSLWVCFYLWVQKKTSHKNINKQICLPHNNSIASLLPKGPFIKCMKGPRLFYVTSKDDHWESNGQNLWSLIRRKSESQVRTAGRFL